MSGVTADEDMKPADGGVYINLKVKGQDGNEVFFRIKRSTRLKRLMTAYCDRVGIHSIAFLFGGRRLRAEQTPDELGMEEGDEIDAMLHPDCDRVTADEDMKPADGSVQINLKVKGQDGNKVFFCIKRSTRLRRLMTAYCDRVDIHSIVFLFDGRRLRAEQTPDEEGDEIDAMLHPDWRVHASSLEESCRSLNGLRLVLP